MNDKPKLNEKDLFAMNKIGKFRMIRLFTKLYNRLCQSCKLKAMKDTRRPLEDYCDKCQETIKELLEKYTK